MIRARPISESITPPPIVRRANNTIRTPITVVPPDIEIVKAPVLIGTTYEQAKKLEALNAAELKKPVEQQVVYVNPASLPPQRTAADGAAWRPKEPELIPAPINKTPISEKVMAKVNEAQIQAEPEPAFKKNPMIIIAVVAAVLLYIFTRNKKR